MSEEADFWIYPPMGIAPSRPATSFRIVMDPPVPVAEQVARHKEYKQEYDNTWAEFKRRKFMFRLLIAPYLLASMVAAGVITLTLAFIFPPLAAGGPGIGMLCGFKAFTMLHEKYRPWDEPTMFKP